MRDEGAGSALDDESCDSRREAERHRVSEWQRESRRFVPAISAFERISFLGVTLAALPFKFTLPLPCLVRACLCVWQHAPGTPQSREEVESREQSARAKGRKEAAAGIGTKTSRVAHSIPLHSRCR